MDNASVVACFTGVQDASVLGSVNVMSIHERYAYDLFSWGDPEGAVGHFLIAETPIEHVLSLFPSLVPPEFDPAGMLQGGEGTEGKSGESLALFFLPCRAEIE